MVAAVGVSSAGTAAAGVALASTMQCSSRSVAAAVWPQQQCGSGSSVASAARWHRRAAWQYQYGGEIAVARQQ